MKKILILLLMIFSLSLSIAAETELTVDEAQNLEKLIKNNITKEYDAIKAGAITDLFKAKFYKVNVKHNYTSYEYTDEILAVNFKGEFNEVSGVKDLTQYIDPAYKIMTQEDTELFAQAVIKLFPNQFRSFRDGIYQEANEWFFIYNEFFGEKDAIVVTVNDEGTITTIEARGGIK